ncbi:ABC transporter ATP-binding protein [Paracoccus sp. (in: a-proteobacteria)]|uniref:ABC transporter ATP-binding protein n=1 Tax=Paracoccus sp. TaxID=267 RepID=UPI00289EEE0F|nr:ABC transporter ATP-binding protein [Paracoccus sp. (in: a-proteobacteria)]
MIKLRNLSKVYRLNGKTKVVADNINMKFPTGRAIALLGRNGAGKSSLLQMIAGTLEPTSGEILSDGSVSWPVGFAGSFHRDLTGEQNCRFVARVYGIDTDEMCDFVERFAELGQHFRLPVRTYSSGMKSRLAFGCSMAVPFDTYLIDEVTAVGDAQFKEKSNQLLLERLENASAIVVSHSLSSLRKICRSGAVLENGKLFYYRRLNDAIEHHMRNMGEAAAATIDEDDD